MFLGWFLIKILIYFEKFKEKKKIRNDFENNQNKKIQILFFKIILNKILNLSTFSTFWYICYISVFHWVWGWKCSWRVLSRSNPSSEYWCSWSQGTEYRCSWSWGRNQLVPWKCFNCRLTGTDIKHNYAYFSYSRRSMYKSENKN